MNQTMELGKVAEWKISNSTTFWHTFHIHINDFQVTEINGEPVKRVNNDDNVAIPPGGSVKMRYLPTDFTGKFVFHCHVLGHEDNGMMGTVSRGQVVQAGTSGGWSSRRPRWPSG